jgi:hypothetical protein
MTRSEPGVNTTGPAASGPSMPSTPGVYLYWIPLGAGAHVVRISGEIYEGLSAMTQRSQQRDLYHSALVAVTDEGPFVIEMTPIPGTGDSSERGVVAEGPVGTRWAARWRVFRYEIRRWHCGVIPDLAFAVSSPIRIADDTNLARRVLDLVPHVPTPVWGRDELRTGEMWNSNSVVSWVLAGAGLVQNAGQPPPGGRAPGWDAGVTVAQRRAARGSQPLAA